MTDTTTDNKMTTIEMCNDCGCEAECHSLIYDAEGMGYWCATCYQANMMEGTEGFTEEELAEYKASKMAILIAFLAEHDYTCDVEGHEDEPLVPDNGGWRCDACDAEAEKPNLVVGEV